MSVPAPVKRACDACHRRKVSKPLLASDRVRARSLTGLQVRCNGRQPCKNCSHSSFPCTYDAIPQKKGPKGPKGNRAKVITQSQKHVTGQARLRDDASSSSASSGRSSPATPTSGLLTTELIRACSDFFFAHIYHTTPIIEKDQLQAMIRSTGQSAEAYCLVASFCAFMLIQSSITTPPDTGFKNLQLGSTLLEYAVNVRKSEDYMANPTLNTIRTSFFLFGGHSGLNKPNNGWFHLRDATAMAELLGMQDENTYMFGDSLENDRKRRLFWSLFIAERAYSLQKHRPLTLHATIEPPSSAENNVSGPITGFLYLVNLYRPFDDMFVGLWSQSKWDCTYYLAYLQQELSNAVPEYLDITDSQAAILRISQQWLRTMVWQLSIMNGCLSSTSMDPSMTFYYPLDIAKDLVAVTSRLSKQSIELYGIGLVSRHLIPPSSNPRRGPFAMNTPH